VAQTAENSFQIFYIAKLHCRFGRMIGGMLKRLLMKYRQVHSLVIVSCWIVWLLM